MLFSYLKLAIRGLFRDKIHSIVNILGLSTGMVVCIFIYQYSSFEFSYDNFYENTESIYRISYQKFLDHHRTENIAKSPAALAPALIATVPEVEIATRLRPFTRITVTFGFSIKFNSNGAFATDTSFLKIFPPDLIRGTSKGEGVLVAESIAEKYFQKTDPINTIISIFEDDKFETKIIGVFKDFPVNTHLRYDILVISNQGESEDSWQWTGLYTYVKLKHDASLTDFSRKMNELAQANVKKEFNVTVKLTPQKLTDIHLHSDLQEELSQNGSYKSLTFLILAGGFVLLIAWINYINLSIAKSTERLKEIGVRKVIGSQKSDLIRQFLIESSLFNVLSLTVAILLTQFLGPYFRILSGIDLTSVDLFSDVNFWMGLSVTTITGIVVTGLYPALIYSKLKPVNALRGALTNSIGMGNTFRKALMVLQFSVTTCLIIGTLVIYRQMDFMRNSDLGLDIEKIIVVKAPNVEKESWSNQLMSYKIDSAYYNKVRTLNNRLSSYNSIKVASISHIPGNELIWGTEGFRGEDADPNKFYALYMAGIDHEFFPVFNVQLLAGRNFSEEHPSDQLTTVILNEEACKLLGFESPEKAIGKRMVFYDDSRKEIIGVVRNFHQESMKRSIKPTFYQLLPRALDYFAISVPSGNLKESVSIIKEQWTLVFGNNPIEYFFLDDHFNEQYKADQKFGDVFTVFTSLSIFVACIGLFGISSYLLIKRTKEICIRKILGASIVNILTLLSGEYLKLTFLSFIIAVPLGYAFTSRWLSNFAFQTPFEWWMFLIPLGIILLISLTTISFHSVRTSLTNPVQSLRSE